MMMSDEQGKLDNSTNLKVLIYVFCLFVFYFRDCAVKVVTLGIST